MLARRPAAERAAVLVGVADGGCERAGTSWPRVIVYEVGKPWREADADVCEAIDFCELLRREALHLDGAAPSSPPG